MDDISRFLTKNNTSELQKPFRNTTEVRETVRGPTRCFMGRNIVNIHWKPVFSKFRRKMCPKYWKQRWRGYPAITAFPSAPFKTFGTFWAREFCAVPRWLWKLPTGRPDWLVWYLTCRDSAALLMDSVDIGEIPLLALGDFWTCRCGGYIIGPTSFIIASKCFIFVLNNKEVSSGCKTFHGFSLRPIAW